MKLSLRKIWPSFHPVITILFCASLWVSSIPVHAQTFFVSTNLDISSLAGNELDPAVAVNPNSPTNIFVAGVYTSANGIFTSYSSDGMTWTSNLIASPTDATLVPAYGEPTVAWDANSNLFLAYLPASQQGIAVAVSTDGGHTFSAFTNLAPNDVTDQPKIVTGLGFVGTNGSPFGSSFNNVWIVYKDYSLFGSPLVAQGLVTTNTGANAMTAFSSPFIIPGSGGTTNGAFPDIACGPSNQVMVAYQNNNFSTNAARVYVNVNTNIFATNGFGSPVLVNSSAVDAVGGYTYIPADNYGNGINAGVGVAWDGNPNSPFYGRSYVAYTAIGAGGLPAMNVVTRYSINNGRAWSSEVQVNDDLNSSMSHFFPRLALDQATGGLALCWYDCRNDYGTGGITVAVIHSASTNYYTNLFDLDGVANDDFMVYMTVSLNGGASYAGNQSAFQIWNSATLGPSGIPPNTVFTYVSSTAEAEDPNGIGTHIGLAYALGDFYPVWPDNSLFLAGNPGPATNLDLYICNAVLPTANESIYISETPAQPNSAQNITYYLIVTNLGPFPATNLVVTNILPANMTIVGITPTAGAHAVITTTSSNQVIAFTYSGSVVLAPGQSMTNQVRVTTTQSGIATNIASVSNPNLPDPFLVNNTATNILAIGVEDLALSMACSAASASIGVPVVYTLSVTNLGPATNGLVYITNTFPATLTQVTNIATPPNVTYAISNNFLIFSFGTLGSNQSSTVSFTATTGSPGPKYQVVTNIAYATSTAFDINITNNYATNYLTLLGEDLGMGLATSETNAGVGDTITFTLSITNLGPSATGNLVLTNILSDNLGQITVLQFPPGSGSLNNNTLIFNMGQLPFNQVITISYTAQALSVNATDTNIVNTAFVTSSDFDTNLTNNTVSLSIPLGGEELSLGLIGTPSTAPVGQTITYTEYVTNSGPSSAGIVNVTNYMSTNLANPVVLQAPGSYYVDTVNNAIIFQLGTISAGQVVPIIYAMTPTAVGLGYNFGLTGSSVFETNLLDDFIITTNVIVAPSQLVSNFTVVAAGNSALISWDTPFNTTGQIAYGMTSNYGSISSVSTSSSHHVFQLSGLVRDTNYYFAASTWGSGVYGVTNGVFFTTNTIILNTMDASFNGTWSQGSPTLPGYYGSYFNIADTTQYSPTASATYTPIIPAQGLYNVSTWFPQSTNFATNTLMYVNGATNAVVTNMNQTANGGAWRALATNMYFDLGTAGDVVIYNSAQTNRQVAANAMRWSYIASQDYPSNGVPPGWWTSYYFGTNTAAAMSNYAAYVFGASPNDPTNTPNFWLAKSSNGLTVTFTPYLGGRLYNLQTSTNLAKPWATLTNQVYVDTNANGIYTNGSGYGIFTLSQTNTNNMFFRISASIIQQ